MNNIFLQTLKVNRDAPYVNRGFYFQYLTVLKKWVGNFVAGNDTIVYTEVGNDIKEVSKKLVYTQIKSYISTFSLNSPPVKKELLGFFLQYLEEYEKNPEIEFHFCTNTSVKKKDTLLSIWHQKQPLKEGPLMEQCAVTVRKALSDQLKASFLKATSDDHLEEDKKQSISQGFEELQEFINGAGFLLFLSKIYWDFGNDTPEKSVIKLHASVMKDLSHDKFGGKPAAILMEALLSEVYRCSQLESPLNRKVTNSSLQNIIELKDAELEAYISVAVINLLDVKVYAIRQRITELETVQKQHEEKISSNADKITELESKSIELQSEGFLKNLTIIPYVNPCDVLGRSGELHKIRQDLVSTKHLLVNGGGGKGKSTLAKLYVQTYRDDYQHLLWVDCGAGLTDSIIVNQTLLDRIKIEEYVPLNKKFDAIINKLELITGKGLIILDNLDGDLTQLEVFRSLENWHVLLTSRKRLANWKEHELEDLTFDAARALYRKFEPYRAADDNLLNELFEFIEYNTFAIELIAKTIHLSFDLTLETFLEYLRGQRLDEDDLDVDLEEGATNTRLLMLLNKTFDIGKLTHQDYYYMEFFAMLPSDGINLPDLVTWYGKEYEKVNKTEFARAINSLHNKGLIKRSGNDIKMDRIFQESVMYQSRKHLNPFVSQLLHVNYLAARLQEGIKGNPSQALHFLKYAQSILKNIKELYRRSLYQPLLLLENETLYITNWLESTEVMLPLWDSLLQRAGKYLGENDAMVGIISNNYALALFGEERLEEAGVYFDKALEISNENRVSPGHLLNILSNRANVYIQQHDFKGFGKVFNEMLEIRTSNDLWDDASFPLQCHALGVANLKGRNYPSAKQMFSIAITSHKKLPVGERNDINLIMFLCNMSLCCLLLKEPELAEKAVVQAVHYLEELKITEGVPMVITIQALIAVAEDKGETDEVAKLKGILETHL